jgi:phosphatidylglycerophosphate synthase
MVQRHYGLSLLLVVVGRLLDIVDGWLADRTGTKSPLGEAFDATADKVGGLAVIVAMLHGDLLPWWAALAILLPHIITSILAARAAAKGHRLHPSRLGKIAMAIGWVSLFGFTVSAWIYGADHHSLYGLSCAVAVIGCVLSAYATYGYGTTKP